MSVIKKQVRLPISVAFGVVMQGIRIRLGRSLVTLAGVVLGIAFLMSILTGQAIRRGVAKETVLRQEVKRMTSFLVAETGPLADRVLGVVQIGPLNLAEERFLCQLGASGIGRVNGCELNGSKLPDSVRKACRVQVVAESAVASEASALLVVGQGALPDGFDPVRLLAPARQKVLALTNNAGKLGATEGLSVVQLAREPREEEIAKEHLEQRRAVFRSGWIIVISLLVTVIGISNAMLMSVTERFREIGTMKCLGALSGFVRQLFFIESSLMGLVGAIIGSLLGAVFAWLAFAATYGIDLVGTALSPTVLLGYFALCVISGVVLSIVAAIYPATFASRMVPATALRSTI